MFNSYQDLMNFLSNLRSMDYQRENFDRFLKKIKFSYDVPSIHIAGTNGKGSVGTILNNIYINAGYKVGYYKSPYFIYPNETISINNNGIDVAYFSKIINQYQKEIKKYDLSQFEVETLVALSYFKENNCDIAIIECGMGGEIDATNIFTPILSIITSIALEHTSFLGSSISEIAFEKAGIIKDDVPVICGQIDDDALQAIVSVCKDTNSMILKADDFFNESIVDDKYVFDFKPYEKLVINSIAKFTLKDAAIALSSIALLKEKFIVTEDDIRKGLLQFNLKGRMNIMNASPKVIVDGAHNPEAMNALVESIEAYNTSNLPIHVVFAAFKDKNIDLMLASMSFISKDITLTTFDHPRARSKDEYFLFLDEYNYEDDAFKLLETKMNEYPNDLIIVCGSLAFAGYMINNFNWRNK